MSEIRRAQLDWDENGQPLSAEFGDVYFSRANGLEETRHVFLQHNQLAERWRNLHAGEVFTIAETGFGSGLNFLAAWQLWLEVAPTDAYLHFVSVELFPLSQTDLKRALSLWPELADLAAQLTSAYPVILDKGFQRLSFMQGRVKLTLIIDDAAQGFSQLLGSAHPRFARECAAVDAWFLDGFAPAKNPQMWSDALFDALGQLSREGTTAATFSAAGIVRNGLRRVGFAVKKVPGFGRKREMVAAVCIQSFQIESAPHQHLSVSPYPAPWAVSGTPQPTDKRALIIGAGLAGASSARALAERGWQVHLVEQHADLAQEGSGNPQGVVYAKLSPKNEPLAQFNVSALQFALNCYGPLWQQLGTQCGVLQLAAQPENADALIQLRAKIVGAQALVEWVEAARASELAGVELHQGGLYFPTAGWLAPRRLCEYWLDHPNITCQFNCPVDTLEFVGNQEDAGYWQVRGPDFSAEFPQVIIATARDAQRFAQCAALPIRAIRGQVSYLPATSTSQALRTVVCAEGYIAPAQAGQHCCGATFNLREESRELRIEDHQTNLDHLAQVLPQLGDSWQAKTLQGRVAFRCTTPDYLPMLGQVPQFDALERDFTPLRKNARAVINQAGSYWPGLHLNIGHGSRGLAYTPLCAELLAAQLNREVLPLGRELVDALNPARFFIRDLIKNRR